MAIEIISFRKLEKNTLRGFLTVRLTNVGLEIRDCTVHEKASKRWIVLPARQYTDKDGEERWALINYFYDDGRFHQFTKVTLKALDKFLATEQPPEQRDKPIPF